MKTISKFLTVLVAVLSIAAFLLSADRASLQTRQTTNNSAKVQAIPQETPRYRIINLGVTQVGDTAAQGFGISTRDGIAVGRSVRTGAAQAFLWSRRNGLNGLPNLSGRAFCVSNSANDAGGVVGTCAATLFGTNKLPVVWQNGAATQLTLPAGETIGDANDVNASGVSVGSVGGGSLQRGAIYNGANATVISQATATGSFFVTAFGINDSGRVVGQGIDPTNAARNVGIFYDIGSSSAFEVGALPNANGALAFGVSNSGLIVGSSMQNQGAGLPFIWSQAGGMQPIPLPAGTASGSARAVNSVGWAVGTGSGQFAVPFLYDGATTYRLQDLIPANSGWDLSANTSSSALGISDRNVIVGTGVLKGQVCAYAMVPIGTVPYDFFDDARTSLATIGTQGGSLVWRRGPGHGGIFFGQSDDVPVAGNYNGLNRTEIAVFRSGTWYWLNEFNNTISSFHFGQAGDIPVPADFTRDGRAELTVYRAGVWYMYNLANNQTFAVQFGAAGDKPVAADYDGDSKTDVAVYRDGTWYWLRSSDSQVRGVRFGAAGDKPVTGDYDGDGLGDQAVFRSGVWYLNRSTDGFYAVQFGAADDIPLLGDYNGDGRSDIAVYRPSTSTFYWLNSPTNTTFNFRQQGQPNDIPVAGR
jgi:hypothetical protein